MGSQRPALDHSCGLLPAIDAVRGLVAVPVGDGALPSRADLREDAVVLRADIERCLAELVARLSGRLRKYSADG